MLLTLLTCISLVFSAGYAQEISGDEILTHFDESNLCENKIMAVLSVTKTETDRKLEALEKHLAENFEETINRKMYALEYKIPDRLEEILDRKFYKLEMRLLDKLEEFMNEKLHTVEKKLDVLEKMIPNDLDGKIEILNFNIDTLKKRMTDLENNVTYQLKAMTNKTAEKNINDKNDINHKPNTVKTEISNSQNDSIINYKRDILDDKILDIAESISHKLDSLQNMIPDLEKNINSKLKTLDKKISEKYDENINRQLNTVEKTKMPESKDNTTTKSHTFESEKIEQNIDDKLYATQKKIPDLEKNITNKDATQNSQNMENKTLGETYRSPDNLRCKERVAHGYNFEPLYRIDNETLNHVRLNRTATGNITYFEMHIAIKAAKDGLILLSPVLDPSTNDRVFELCIGISNNQQTDLRLNLMKNGIGQTSTPDILSPTYYVAFCIKIANGKLELGREGSSTPLISYEDKLLNSVKYFGFGSWDNREANFLYDCPAMDF